MNGKAKRSSTRRVGYVKDAEKKMRGSSSRVGDAGGLRQEVPVSLARLTTRITGRGRGR